MTMNTLYANDAAKTLIAQWKEAKDNEAGWNAVRKEAEEALKEHYKAEFDAALISLNDTTSLTTTVGIDDALKVTIGNELKIDQAAAAEFIRAYPTMLGVLLKAEYKPTSSAVVIGKLKIKDPIGEALDKVVSFKDKSPSFAAIK
jgi:hypothetical protein